jgi:hypothetical protein
MRLFALRKNASELLVLRRLRLLARGDLYHAVKDLRDHVHVPPEHGTPDTMQGLSVLMCAHVGYCIATSPVYQGLVNQTQAQPKLQTMSFCLDPDWFLETRQSEVKLDLPLNQAALAWTLSLYQAPAQKAKRRLELVGAGTKLLAGLGGLTLCALYKC